MKFIMLLLPLESNVRNFISCIKRENINIGMLSLILVRVLTDWSPIRSVIIRVITKWRESDLLITSMITDRHRTYQLIIKITVFEKHKK